MDPNNENPEDTSVLDALVGDGKKYKTVADLAKAYAHADVFIGQLKAENTTIKEKADTLEAKLEILDKLATNPQAKAQGNETPAVETPSQVSQDDMEAKIRSTVEQLSEERKRTENTQKVDTVLLEKFGETDKATEFLKNKAIELGLGVKFLTDLAASSPQAFYATVGLDVTPTAKSDPAPKSTVNTATLSNSTAKPNTYAWYEELRRTDKARFNSAKTQLQMHQDAGKPGFFG